MCESLAIDWQVRIILGAAGSQSSLISNFLPPQRFPPPLPTEVSKPPPSLRPDGCSELLWLFLTKRGGHDWHPPHSVVTGVAGKRTNGLFKRHCLLGGFSVSEWVQGSDRNLHHAMEKARALSHMDHVALGKSFALLTVPHVYV